MRVRTSVSPGRWYGARGTIKAADEPPEKQVPTLGREIANYQTTVTSSAQPKRMREAHGIIEEGGDVTTTSILEVFIDETERRVWFLYEATHVRGDTP